MGEDRLFAVSNREPYEHRHGANGTECIVPASGLVTALEPILRALQRDLDRASHRKCRSRNQRC